MKERSPAVFILATLGGMQFFFLPVFRNMSLGWKVAALSLFAILLGVFLQNRKNVFSVPGALLPLAGLILAFSVSLVFSAVPMNGLIETWTLAIGVVFCLLIANVAQEDDHFQRRVLDWLAVLGLVVAFLCLYQYFHWLAMGSVSEMLIPYILPPAGRRVTGIYGQANLTALLLLLSMVAFIYRYTLTERGCFRGGSMVCDLGMLAVVVAFFLTGSRSGLLGLVAVSVLIGFSIRRKKLEIPPFAVLRIILIFVFGFVLTYMLSSSELYVASNQRWGFSIDERYFFWAASMLMFLDAPLLGVGPDHFRILLPSYARDAHEVLGFIQYEAMGYSRWAHNEFLQILAETGLVGCLFLSFFLIALFRLFLKETAAEKVEAGRFFLILLIIPFLVQGMFEWPFRHPALLFIFFMVLGVYLSKAPSFSLSLSRSVRVGVSLILLASIPAIAFFSYKEFHFAQTLRAAAQGGCGVVGLSSILDDPYLKLKGLQELLPYCVRDEEVFEDKELMKKLLPYFREIAELQGTHSQWYNLGLVYRSLDFHESARAALWQSVERQPVFDRGWVTLHALNVEKAVRKTGRPIEDFLPSTDKPSLDYDDFLFPRQ